MEPPSPSPAFLVDVRTPEEFSTGHLDGAINIEYQLITDLVHTFNAKPSDDIVLYCRSGRRSAIALVTLRQMGYSKLRDLGNIDEARRILQQERQNLQAPPTSCIRQPPETVQLKKGFQSLLERLEKLEKDEEEN